MATPRPHPATDGQMRPFPWSPSRSPTRRRKGKEAVWVPIESMHASSTAINRDLVMGIAQDAARIEARIETASTSFFLSSLSLQLQCALLLPILVLRPLLFPSFSRSLITNSAHNHFFLSCCPVFVPTVLRRCPSPPAAVFPSSLPQLCFSAAFTLLYFVQPVGPAVFLQVAVFVMPPQTQHEPTSRTAETDNVSVV